MAPTLRSAGATPTTQRTTRNSAKTPVVANASPGPKTPNSTPRRCATCKRPRKGHPRSGCPFGEDGTDAEDVEERMSALDLSVTGDEDDEEGQDTDIEIEQTVHKDGQKAKKERIAMPGTLAMASFLLSESSQASQHSGCKTEDTESSISSLDDTSRPLTRTPSLAERESFLDKLATVPLKAVIYVIPAASIPIAVQDASSRGLFTHVLNLDYADSLLLVGSTEAAVKVLKKQVETKMHELVPKNGQKGKNGLLGRAVKTLLVAGVGAVAAFGALAFA